MHSRRSATDLGPVPESALSLRRNLTSLVAGVVVLATLPIVYQLREKPLVAEREARSRTVFGALNFVRLLAAEERTGTRADSDSNLVTLLEEIYPDGTVGPAVARYRDARSQPRPVTPVVIDAATAELLALAAENRTRLEAVSGERSRLQGLVLAAIYLAVLGLVAAGLVPAIRRADEVMRDQARSEDERTAMLVTSGDSIALVDRDGNIRVANDELMRVAGRDDLTGVPLAEIVRQDGPASSDGVASGQLLTPGGPVSAEIRRSVLGHGDVLVVAKDLTGTDDLRRALLEEEGRRRAILRSLPDVVVQLDAEDHVAWAHSPSPGVLSRSQDALIGCPVEEVVPPERSVALRDAVRRVRSVGEEAVYGYRARRPGSSDLQGVDWEVRVVPAEDGAVLILLRDVTRERTRDRELARKSANLVEAEKIGRFGSWVSGGSGVVALSEGGREVIGLAPGQPEPTWPEWDARIHPDDLPRVHAQRVRTARGEPYEVTYRVRDYRDRDLHVLIRGRAGVGDDGRPTNYGTIQDVTLEALQREDLRRATAEAQEASRLKSQFLANMSHEIRTPMHGVLGMLHLLSETTLDERQRHYADTVRTSAESLLGIIDDILDLSKIEAGRMRLESIPLDLGELLHERADPFSAIARRRGLDLDLLVPEDVPDVAGDPVRLGQIVTNLLSNALKFTERGGVRVELAHEDRPEGRVAIAITVADTGIGIPADRIERIFDSFVQADGGTTRLYGGSGLGLTIVRELATLMGGGIEALSSPEGSVFTVRLVLPRATLRETVLIAPVTEDLRGRRILVAEDNPVNQSVAREILQSVGAIVVIAPDGEEAVRAVLEDGPFDLIFMDIQMPRMDGYAATRAIREIIPDAPPIVAMTANAGESDRRRALEAGMADFAAKPLRPAELIARAARWANLSHDSMEAPGPSAHTAFPRFDDAVLDEAFGEMPELKARILAQYLESSPDYVEKAERAAVEGDGEAFGFAAHGLKGSSRTIGAARLGELCANAEKASPEGRPALVRELRAEYDALAEELRERTATA